MSHFLSRALHSLKYRHAFKYHSESRTARHDLTILFTQMRGVLRRTTRLVYTRRRIFA